MCFFTSAPNQAVFSTINSRYKLQSIFLFELYLYLKSSNRIIEFFSLFCTLFVLYYIFFAFFIFFKVLQASLCVFLGTSLNINNENQQISASRANDFVLVLNMLIVGANIVINAFDMKESSDNEEATRMLSKAVSVTN